MIHQCVSVCGLGVSVIHQSVSMSIYAGLAFGDSSFRVCMQARTVVYSPFRVCMQAGHVSRLGIW